MATALARLQHDPLRPRQIRPGIPRALEDVVCRAMARDPADRYDSTSDLRAALLAGGAAPDVDVTEAALGALPGPTVVVARPGAAPGPASPPAAVPSFRQSERDLLIPTVIVVVVALALGIAGLLLGRSGAFDGVRSALGGSGHTGTPVPIVEATPFDPPALGGDGNEHADLAALAIDGKVDTAWHTDRYNDRDITKLKSGVGLILRLNASARLGQLQIESPTNDWKVAIYVAESVPSSFADWGTPITTRTLPKGTNKIDLKGHRGSAVLIWILDRGDGGGPAAAEIAEAGVTSA